MENNKTEQSNFFVKLSLTTVMLTLGLIVFGAVVRVTDSGLGCGNDWPLCDGRIVPPLDNVTAWIEWSHRLFAALIGVFGLWMLGVAWRSYRRRHSGVLNITAIAAGIFVLQSALGAFVVIYDLPPTMVTLHLGTAMLLLGALLMAAVMAWHRPPPEPTGRDSVTALAYITAALTLVIILTGTLVRGSGATLACADWPLCNGQVLPFSQGTLETVHMMHRYAVLGLGLTQLMLVYYVLKMRANPITRRLTVAAFVVYLMQAGVGALYVFSEAAAIWGAAHVGMAAVTWALLVAVCTVDTLDGLSSENQEQKELTWQAQS
ncbi:MAG: heme A synthase [Anaerolineaceae bacterium]|nr:MAG: heme A synthase [Anaerolineaceae bacterium]